MESTLIILWISVVVAFVIMNIYNKIITLKNNRENAFADIDVQLKLRFDLLPNLVSTVKGYATHESKTLQDVTEARTKYMSAGNVEDKIWANNMLTQALGKLFALQESYPDLKANQNFLTLQTELSDIENKLAASRRFFNSATKEFNTYIQHFPNNIIANIFNYSIWEYFDVENKDEIKNTPKVSF